MLINDIQNNINKYLEDFEPQQVNDRMFKIDFCDKELLINKYDYYAIYAINMFFNFFTCIDDADLINDFIKTAKQDILNENFILDKIDEYDLDAEEKKEWIKEYIDTVKNKKDVLSFMIEVGLF
jgi:hypothetical protein